MIKMLKQAPNFDFTLDWEWIYRSTLWPYISRFEKIEVILKILFICNTDYWLIFYPEKEKFLNKLKIAF